MRESIKDVNLILEKVIDQINNGKDKMFNIVESLRDEFTREKQELDSVLEEIGNIIEEVDKLEKKDKEMRQKLANVSSNLKNSEDLVRSIYEEALDIKVEYITKQKEEKELRKKRDKLQISLKNYLKNIEEADSVVRQVNVALNYLCGDFGTTIENIEESSQMNMAIKVLEIQEEERGRIAREVHDGPAQYLASALMRIDFSKKVIKEDMKRGLQEMEDLKLTVNKALKEVRGIIFNLRPPFLDKQTLEESIQDLVDTFLEENNIELKVNIKKCKECEQAMEIGVYRIIQELLTNIRRHSEAGYAEIMLEMGSESIYLVVKDDGIGFDLNEVIDEAKKNKTSYGIIGILDRVESLGGSVDINSKIHSGTKYKIKLPITRGKKTDD